MTLTIVISIDDIEQSFVTTIPDDLTTPLAVVSKIMMAAIAEAPSAEVTPRRRGPNKPKLEMKSEQFFGHIQCAISR